MRPRNLVTPKHLIISLSATAGIALVYSFVSAPPATEAEPPQNAQHAEANTSPAPASQQQPEPPAPLANLDRQNMGEGASLMMGDLSFDQVVALMQKHHGDDLDTALGQIDLINALLNYLRTEYPDNWREMMAEFLRAAFPGMATELIQLADNHLEYETWRRLASSDLLQLAPDERMEILMEHRADIFGKEIAEDLWQHQIRDYEMQKAIENLAAASDRPLDERLDEFSAMVHQQYPEEVLRHQSMALGDSFANKFLAATQDELRSMPAHERRETIARTRRSLGYNERAVENLARLDRTRDRRWDAGQTYMQSRREITSNYDGEERQRRLDEVRRSLLGAQADTIRREEEAGYYRYEQERSFGIH